MTLRVNAVEAIETLAAGCDSAHDYPLPYFVVSLQPFTELVDDPDRLVAEDQSRPHGILPANDVDVRSANRRRRNPDHRFTSPGPRFGYLLDADIVDTVKHDCLHRMHDGLPVAVSSIRIRRGNDDANDDVGESGGGHSWAARCS